jgi:glycosyltransferase involved in cell wall biosynthesis
VPADTTRLLLICHVSVAEAAVQAARKVWGETQDRAEGRPLDIDMVCYGRASAEFAAPEGTRLMRVPIVEGTSLVRGAAMLAGLRRGRYEAVALSQPALGLNRARGLLLAFTFLVGGKRAVVLDPTARRERRSITLGLVAVDLARWLVLQVISLTVAALAARIVDRFSDHPPPHDAAPMAGSVLYLRTDVELRAAPLRAGGSVAHTEGILRALQEREHEVGFWCTGEVDGVPEEIPQRRLRAVLKGNLPTEIGELISGLLQGCLPPQGFRPTGFIYQRYSLNNLAGVILARRWRVPLILEANSSEAKWRQDWSLLRFPRLGYACERLVLSSADAVSAVSANAAEDLVAAGAPRERLRIVPNGVIVARFADATPIALPEGCEGFVVCFVGLFYPWHGVRFLAEAFALFHARRPDARLVLVGDGEEAPAVRSVLARNGAMTATHFAGLVSREEAPRYMAAADVLVSPHANVHRFIGSPIKVFEYMAAGKPIVATRVAQLQDVLTDGQTALLVEPEDPEAMAQALERLYADRELRRELGEAARVEALRNHSWDARLSSLLDGSPRAARRDGA